MSQVEGDSGQQSTNASVAGHQEFELLEQPPVLPFIDIAREFITDRADSAAVRVSYIEKAVEGSGAVLNETKPSNVSTSARSLANRSPARFPERNPHGLTPLRPLLVSRAEKQCDESSPCPDGSCCNKDGKCGFGKEVCGKDVCISNCKWFTQHCRCSCIKSAG